MAKRHFCGVVLANTCTIWGWTGGYDSATEKIFWLGPIGLVFDY